MNINIRSVTLMDFDDAYYVECTSFPIDERASVSAFKDRIRTFPDTFLLAEIDNKIVGVINSGSWDFPYFDDILYKDITAHKADGIYQAIYGVSVLPEYRKYGIASSLIQKIIDIANTNNKKGLVLSCKKELIFYYEKFGFVNQGSSRSDLGGESWNDMLLVLS